MGIRRYQALQDTTISNAFEPNLSTRATGANIGLADSLEIFHIYAQANTSSSENSRILIQFPVTGSSVVGTIAKDRADGILPGSGSCQFVLRMFDVKHPYTLPRNCTIEAKSLTSPWVEGVGLDLDTYQDLVYDDPTAGTTWDKRCGTSSWISAGGDVQAAPVFTQVLNTGDEDLELDISDAAERWLAGSQPNEGLLIKLQDAYEASINSYYTKRYSARGSQYWFKRPVIEVRHNDARYDDRGSFYFSSSAAPAASNLYTLYFYNYFNGELANIPSIGSTGSIFVTLYSGSATNAAPTGTALSQSVVTVATGGYVSTGIYSASLCLTSSMENLTHVFDVWSSGNIQFYTGSISISKQLMAGYDESLSYITSIANFRDEYTCDETDCRIRLNIRERDWSPNSYVISTRSAINHPIKEAYYALYRSTDDFEIVRFLTGSTNNYATRLSYDVSGNYFNFDMSLLEKDYQYYWKFMYRVNGRYVVQPEKFVFRITE